MSLKLIPLGVGILLVAAFYWGSSAGLVGLRDEFLSSEAKAYGVSEIYTERVPAPVGSHVSLDEAKSVPLDLRNLPLELPEEVKPGLAEDNFPDISVWFSNLHTQARGNFREVSANLFKYRHVSTRSYRVSRERLLKQSGLLEDPWFWELTPAAISERIKLLPWVEDVELETSFYPLSLSLDVREAEPWLVAEYQGFSWLVSSSGELLEPLEKMKNPEMVVEVSQLMRLSGLDKFEQASNTLSSPNARFEFAVKQLSFLEMAGGFPFKVERVELTEEGALRVEAYELQKYPLVILKASSFKDAELVLARLQKILADLERRRERARKIDLRFSNQAVVQ